MDDCLAGAWRGRVRRGIDFTAQRERHGGIVEWRDSVYALHCV
jgi:hypothetical protein